MQETHETKLQFLGNNLAMNAEAATSGMTFMNTEESVWDPVIRKLLNKMESNEPCLPWLDYPKTGESSQAIKSELPTLIEELPPIEPNYYGPPNWRNSQSQVNLDLDYMNLNDGTVLSEAVAVSTSQTEYPIQVSMNAMDTFLDYNNNNIASVENFETPVIKEEKEDIPSENGGGTHFQFDMDLCLREPFVDTTIVIPFAELTTFHQQHEHMDISSIAFNKAVKKERAPRKKKVMKKAKGFRHPQVNEVSTTSGTRKTRAESWKRTIPLYMLTKTQCADEQEWERAKRAKNTKSFHEKKKKQLSIALDIIAEMRKNPIMAMEMLANTKIARKLKELKLND